MTTPARHAEADDAEVIYYWALTQLGARTIEDALVEFEAVPASQRAATAAGWLSRAIELVMFRRSQAREIALAYYRLVRALRTGYSIYLPDRDEPERVSLDMLRSEFNALIDTVEEEALSAPESAPQDTAEQGPAGDSDEPAAADDGPTPALPDEAPPLTEADDDDQIILEELERLEDLIREQEERAEQEAAAMLDKLGIEEMLKDLEQIADDAEDADAQAEAARTKAAGKQAAEAERISLNAARGLVYSMGDYDGRCLGWVRYSQTGTPCGWCAMLIAREVLYKSKSAAQLDGSDSRFNEFHKNCHCVAVPIFSMEQFNNSPLFALNREYRALWPKVTEGYGGKEAIRRWRKHFRSQAQAA